MLLGSSGGNRPFSNPKLTAKGEARASISLRQIKTLWFNSGTLCNLHCENCYIESSPKNDRLAYLTAADVVPFLDELISHPKLAAADCDIGITGGEPLINPHIFEILEAILKRNFKVLVLTNAYKVIKRCSKKLLTLKERYPEQLQLRVSLDHYTMELHEAERGEGTLIPTLESLKWLTQAGFYVSLAGRALIEESLEKAKNGYSELLETYSVSLPNIAENLIVFPEMDTQKSVPEITTQCWGILNKNPNDIMCASSRMIVKKKGADRPVIQACTLLAYDDAFELGPTLVESEKKVYLNHPFCAQFCVLGGASCSG